MEYSSNNVYNAQRWGGTVGLFGPRASKQFHPAMPRGWTISILEVFLCHDPQDMTWPFLMFSCVQAGNSTVFKKKLISVFVLLQVLVKRWNRIQKVQSSNRFTSFKVYQMPKHCTAAYFTLRRDFTALESDHCDIFPFHFLDEMGSLLPLGAVGRKTTTTTAVLTNHSCSGFLPSSIRGQ